jgi:hypothetical protein
MRSTVWAYSSGVVQFWMLDGWGGLAVSPQPPMRALGGWDDPRRAAAAA